LQIAVVPDLLAFLTDDRADDGNESGFVAAVAGEETLGYGEDAEDDFGEGFGQGDGVVEVVDGEIVLAGLDGGVLGVSEDAVGGEDVDLFLLGDCQLFVRGLGEMEGLRSPQRSRC